MMNERFENNISYLIARRLSVVIYGWEKSFFPLFHIFFEMKLMSLQLCFLLRQRKIVSCRVNMILILEMFELVFADISKYDQPLYGDNSCCRIKEKLKVVLKGLSTASMSIL